MIRRPQVDQGGYRPCVEKGGEETVEDSAASPDGGEREGHIDHRPEKRLRRPWEMRWEGGRVQVGTTEGSAQPDRCRQQFPSGSPSFPSNQNPWCCHPHLSLSQAGSGWLLTLSFRPHQQATLLTNVVTSQFGVWRGAQSPASPGL